MELHFAPGWTDWLSAISAVVSASATVIYAGLTFGLLVAASGAAFFAHRAWVEQRRANDGRDRELAEQRADGLASQARLISAWVEEGDDRTQRYSVILSNRSDAPVYDVLWAVNGYGEAAIPGLLTGSIGVLPPRQHLPVAPLPWAIGDEILVEPDSEDELLARRHAPGDFRVRLEFRDARSTQWVRSDRGELEAQ